MINKIYTNPVSNQVNFRHNPNKNVASNYSTLPNTNYTTQGTNALANYNKLFLNIDKDKLLDVKTITPIIDKRLDFNEIEGEKVYSSTGKLEAIIQENDTEKIFYYPNQQGNKIGNINLVDKETGKIIKQQSFDDTSDYYTVNGFDANGNKIGTSSYYNGKNMSNYKDIKNKFGKEISIGHNNDYNEYWMTLHTKDDSQRLRINFDYKKQINEIFEHNEFKQGTINKCAFFNDGALVSIKEDKTTYIPNLTGTEKLKNPDFVAHTKYDVITDAAKYEGEKTFYSNGALETNTFETEHGLVTYTFSPEGNIKNIKDADLEIDLIQYESNKSYQIVKENLGNNKYRNTTYNDEDKLLSIEVQENDIAKTIDFDTATNNMPKYYYEEKIIDKNTDEKQRIMSFRLNKDGMVTGEY